MKNLFTAIAKHNARQRARQELDNLTDRELADIGISRSEIPGIVRNSYV